MVTPEYSLSPSGALSNAVDFLYAEWTIKAVGFVGHGSAGEHPRGGACAGQRGASGDRWACAERVVAVHGLRERQRVQYG
ncbi:NAD(P)H-dependent oxidoreductase [Streptomyces sp. NPDC051098]|uniref:NAD(P)H-dependent oxidoreductase n=1 Tax=Streptomyces sp. NPDC051098 TaxID=3155411 RepID=UPI00341C603E